MENNDNTGNNLMHLKNFNDLDVPERPQSDAPKISICAPKMTFAPRNYDKRPQDN